MEVADCGAACLAMVLGYFGKPTPLGDVRDMTGAGRGGVDALGIVQAAQHYGLIARGVQADLKDLHLLPPGSILHWAFDHFVVFERLRRYRTRRGLLSWDAALESLLADQESEVRS